MTVLMASAEQRLTSPLPSRRRCRRRTARRVRIHIPRQGDHCVIDAKEVPLAMAPGSVREHNHHLLEILKAVRLEIKRTGSIQLTPSFYERTMRDLRKIGLSAYTSLGTDFMEKFNELEKVAGASGLALTITTNTFPLLWEMLYTGSSRGNVHSGQFVGFCHRIARCPWGARPSLAEEIDADSDFLFCASDQLGHWQRELDAVRRLASPHFRFRLLGDILAERYSTVSVRYLSDHLVDVLALPELGVVHLACHCLPDPDRSGVLFSELILSGPSWHVRIKLHELKAAWDIKFSLEPLVFLNACKTMTSPDFLIQNDSFPGGFLQFGASGVIATACDVPDLFAAEFAAKFYENLFVNDGGRSPTLSETLLGTRQFFINPPYYNPLGLAYGLYARNDLHIEWEPLAADDVEGWAS